ncbi:MAG: hypothetical protein V1736_09315 [Pseudomonadota bacterium]
MDKTDEIVTLHRQGKSLREIAKQTGLSHSGVRYKLNKAGVNSPETEDEGRYIDPYEYPELLEAYRELNWKIGDVVRALKRITKDVNERRLIIETSSGWKVHKER